MATCLNLHGQNQVVLDLVVDTHILRFVQVVTKYQKNGIFLKEKKVFAAAEYLCKIQKKKKMRFLQNSYVWINGVKVYNNFFELQR